MNILPLAMIGTEPLLIVLMVVLLLFGGNKIPELMRNLGRGAGELQKGIDEGKRALTDVMHDDSHAK